MPKPPSKTWGRTQKHDTVARGKKANQPEEEGRLLEPAWMASIAFCWLSAVLACTPIKMLETKSAIYLSFTLIQSAFSVRGDISTIVSLSASPSDQTLFGPKCDWRNTNCYRPEIQSDICQLSSSIQLLHFM